MFHKHKAEYPSYNPETDIVKKESDEGLLTSELIPFLLDFAGDKGAPTEDLVNLVDSHVVLGLKRGYDEESFVKEVMGQINENFPVNVDNISKFIRKRFQKILSAQNNAREI